MLSGLSNFLYKLTHWESWHHHVKYIPLLPVWLWYCFKSRSMWFFTASNPTLTFGGMEGEGKMEMYTQLPPGTYPPSIFIATDRTSEEVETLIAESKINYPFAVKPDVGMMGFMFRKIYTPEDLRFYHEKVPVNYVIQAFIDYPEEAGVFYYRFPSQTKGTITGVVKKASADIIGDGSSTLRELILKFPGARFSLKKMFANHEKNLHKIFAAGEKYSLSDASNRSQGGKMVGINFENGGKLAQVLDELSLYKGNFYYGRYDIKCASTADLLEGRNFSVLEYNGSGSGIQHMHGRGLSLWDAWKTILHHWEMLYRIADYNNRHGVAYWKFSEGLVFLRKAKKNLQMLKKLDAEFPALPSQAL